ncbi:MAG TPA: NAD-dependent epimerase/dehydratase family protein [Gemmatimonadaceae bacterium]|jgi:UDP-glucose 4-epimerase
MPTSLVTGGAGFIGSHVAQHCLNTGHQVVVLDDLSGGFRDHVPEGAIFVEGTITDVDLLSRLFDQHHFDYVYHLAAYAAEGLSHFIRRFNYTNNVVGSINLINESVKHEVKCFVFTSSIAVYGAGQVPMTETMVPQPEDPYGIAKYAVELDLHAAHEMFGLNSVVFRPHNVYGEHQNIGDRYRNVIGIFMNQIMQGQPLSVFGDGEQTRAFSFIDDVAPHIARSVDVPAAYNQVINIGADVPYSVNQLAEVVSRALGVTPNVTHLPPRNEVVHAYSSHDKARKIFGDTKPVTLEEGIERMAAWAKRVGARESSTFGNIEVTRNLPASWRAATSASGS